MTELVTHAVITGRVHRNLQQNVQDVAFAGRAGENAFGIVLDGCGARVHFAGVRRPSSNEVGARLLGQFMAAWLAKHLPQRGSLPSLLSYLHWDSLHFMGNLLHSLPMSGAEKERFVAGHLLCTVAGFVVTPTDAIFFWRGDGYLNHNGDVTYLDNDNTPNYIAYDLLEGKEPGNFKVRSLEREELKWLAVATDGWHGESLAALETPRSPLELKRWLNVQGRRPGFFNDDGAVAAWYGNGCQKGSHEE